MLSDDRQLFFGIRQGRYADFNALFNRYYQGLCLFVTRYTHDADVAEDIVQELFTKLWIKREGLDVNANPKSYLFVAAKNSTLNYFRQEKHRLKAIDQAALPDIHIDESAIEMQEFEAALARCIDELPERSREVFMLSRFDGLKLADIAQKLDTSVKTVKNQVWKSLQYLKTCLKDKGRVEL